MLSRFLGGMALIFAGAVLAQPPVQVGSKRFTESYILGEIVAQTITAAGETRAGHRQGLGNTAIVFAALKSGAIDLYPEYTGTLALELLGLARVPDLAELNRALAPHGVAASVPLGFGNGYALALPQAKAEAAQITRLSDLAAHKSLRYGLTQEFLNRKDGWPALRAAYGLAGVAPRGLDHGVAYEALAAGSVDVIDIYTTDAKIARYRLRVLADDRGFFPEYDAVLLHRLDFPQRFPQSWHALNGLQGRITPEQMIAMNGAAELAGQPFSKVAADYLAGRTAAATMGSERPALLATLFGADFWRLTGQHLVLVFVSLGLGIVVGVPLGIWASKARRARYWIMGCVGVLQTIPALALLAFLIAVLDRIGTVPAILALFLYSLLPIVRNTESGLASVPAGLRQAGTALGLPDSLRMRLIELPLAARSMLAGIKTSAVINVGTATIAAFVGAGGYGDRIVAGLAVNDHRLLLAGAIPAAVMALALEWGFGAVERRVVSPGLLLGEGVAERTS